MKTLAQVRTELAAGQFEFSRHAFRRAAERNISGYEIEEAGRNAEIIEDYPDDKYSPSALILGFTTDASPLRIQVSFADSELTKIITIYRPDPEQWFEFRKRR